MTLREIAAAIPPGSRWVRRQKRLLAAFAAQPELAELRCDRRATISGIWRFLVRWAYRGDGLSMPVRARLCEALGISVATWKRGRRWIEEHGWLGTVRGGWTPALRASSLSDGDEPNDAAIYVLCIPRRSVVEKPERPVRDRQQPVIEPLRRPPEVTSTSYGSSWAPKPRTRPPVRPELAAYVEVFRQQGIKTLSDRWCAWLCRAFIRAGWSPADVRTALTHHPADGRCHSAATVIKPGPVCAWRLSRWLEDPDGCWQHWREHGTWPAGVTPIASPGQRSWHGVKSRGQEILDRSRAKATRAAAAAVDVRAHAAAARALMAGRTKKGNRS